MLVTIFTPFHRKDTTFLNRLYESLKKQSDQEWQWSIVVNGDGDEADLTEFKKDERIIFTRWAAGNIGQLKKEACRAGTGHILLEVDFDDTIEPTCIAKVKEAFADPSIDFCYSDCFECKADGTTFMPYGAYWGWKYETLPDGRIVTKSRQPSPASFGHIWGAPNHFRAFRKDFYWKIGGHDKNYDVADDHELMCRAYIYGNIKYIEEPLYSYFHHGENTSGQTASDNRNARIQILTQEIHDKYLQALCLKWCKLNNFSAYDLGGRFSCPEGFKSIDLLDADLVMNLEEPWDAIPDNSVGVFRASHLLEHLEDTIFFMNQAYKKLVPGGFLLIQVPSENGTGGSSDPTHKKWFNKRSFRYFYDQSLAQFIQPTYEGKFQCNRINEYAWPAPNQDVLVIDCHLIALKEPYTSNFIGEKLM